MSRRDSGPDDPAYPVCEQARDILMQYEQTPRSLHLPRGPNPYYPYSDIINFLKEESRGKKVFLCKCLKCRKQAGLQGGIANRESRWNEGELLGGFATIYALLIYLRCPGLISIFRQNELSLDKGYLSDQQLVFLEQCNVLDLLQATNIRNEILRTQYQFRVRKFAKRNEITIVNEKETLPIIEDQHPAGKGGFGEVYPFNVRSEYVDDSLKFLQTNRFARKIFKQLPTESEPVKEFVLQQLKSNQFQHPHLMPALAAFEHGRDYFFILFELAESTLYKLLAGDGPGFTTQELWKQVQGLASGLAYLHGILVEGDEQNNGMMIHRDLKPANVLIVKGVMKIADFGLASYDRSWPTTTGSRLTESSIHEGINNYSSPPSDAACQKDDVYSLGAIISEIACFDIEKESGVAQYRQNRLDDAAGGQRTRSRRFYHYETYDMKTSVAKEHSRLLEVVAEESRNPHTSLHPWQEFFFQEALFKMIEKMLYKSKARRPKAEDAAHELREFSQRADHYVAQNVDDRTEIYKVNKWLETEIANPSRPAPLKNRFIAHFAEEKRRCALWLYPSTDNEWIEISRFEYTFDEHGPSLVRESEFDVGRKQKIPSTGVKPVYLDNTKGNAVGLMKSQQYLVYTFRRLSDALRFQGIMTGEHVYKGMSLTLTQFWLRDYHKSSSTSILSWKKKSKEKEQIVRGERAHLQMWTQEKPDSIAGRDIRIAILAGETLHVVNVTGQFAPNAKGLTKKDLPPTVARLAVAETHSIDITKGIPLILDLRKYEKYDEVRLDFENENDVRCFWRNLIELQDEYFPETSRWTVEPPNDTIMTRRNTVGSQETAQSQDSNGPRRGTVSHRGSIVTTLPVGHT